MGNIKNQRKSYSKHHRHAYRKKKLPCQKAQTRKSRDTQTQKQAVSLEGSRIINLEELQKYTEDLNKHASQCQGSPVLSGEVRDGLASILSCQCSTCNHTIRLQTSKKVKGPRGYRRWESNLAAVWGQMSTGGGHSRLEEVMSVAGIPVMTSASFVQTEREIGEVWKQQLLETMAEAGREEKRLAELRNEYHEGIPAITVIVDGGWSKRAHKHSYNANSGVAIIIGAATKKLLYIGVRNKYCSACTRNIPRDKHVCFRNWSESSSEMETDIILEGFLEAERVHGVRYTKFIGDGDSSVHSTLLQNVPGWGHAIRKLECANHACKCYRGALERLVQDNPSYKGSGGLPKTMRKRLVSAARSAIRMRSKETDRKKALASLKHDLQNGPLHCFGFHQHCSADFCTTAQKQAQQATTTSTSTMTTSTTSTSPSTSASSTTTSSSSALISASATLHSAHSPVPSTSAASSISPSNTNHGVDLDDGDVDLTG